MTRREEIEQAAMNSYPDCPERGFGTGDYEYPEFHDDEREAFIEGAKWADKTMIEKACEWLKKCFYEQEHECDYGYYITLENTFDELNDVIESFRKAMEE